MFSPHTNLAYGLSSLAATVLNKKNIFPRLKIKTASALVIPASLTKIYLTNSIPHQSIYSHSLLSAISHNLSLFSRFLQLVCIFSPAIILSPIYLIPSIRWIWIRVFSWCIERAGVAWIKLFQFLSHREDMVGN